MKFGEGTVYRRNSIGYTLVELLDVRVITGILAGIAVPVYGHLMDSIGKICASLIGWRWQGFIRIF